MASPQPEGGELPLPPVLKADTQGDCCGGPSKALTDGPCNEPLSLDTLQLESVSPSQVWTTNCSNLQSQAHHVCPCSWVPSLLQAGCCGPPGQCTRSTPAMTGKQAGGACACLPLGVQEAHTEYI